MIHNVLLRDVIESDLPVFFEQQLDPTANYMAAFTASDPTDRAAFLAHWTRVLGDQSNIIKTILADGRVAGNVVSYEELGEREVGYWLGRPYWGKGIATSALTQFLEQVTTRPLFARAAKDNIGSLRVLQKCGFVIIGENKAFANGRGEEVEEWILTLDSSGR